LAAYAPGLKPLTTKKDSLPHGPVRLEENGLVAVSSASVLQ
jgi:hypothetical protein